MKNTFLNKYRYSFFPFKDKIDWNLKAVIRNNKNNVIHKIIDWWKNKNIEEIIFKKSKKTDRKNFENL